MAKSNPILSTRDAAAHYISKGWQVVPLAPGTKACKDEAWPKLVFKAEDFKPDDNIGIRSLNGLVDIDCDALEVVGLADAFLPTTHACYGRKTKPKSHRLYRSTFEKIIAYKDLTAPPDKNTLIEIRVNHQSMAPPSVHPSGEPIEWSGPLGDAPDIEPDDLHRAVRLLASSAMIARHYNKPGDRHDWGLALAGTLRQFGLSEIETKLVFGEAARWVRDEHVVDRMNAIRATYGRGEDDPVKASKALTAAMANGKTFVATLRKIWSDGSGSAFLVDAKGERILANSQENVRRALAKLEANLSFDVFSQKARVSYNGYKGPLQDNIRDRLWLEIDRQFHFRPTGDFFDVVLRDTANRNAFHPVLDYLKTLTWDGTARVDEWLIKSGGAADTDYVRAVSALVLIAAVRRARHPGCKFDEVMVLESDQGMLKSSALQALCPNPDWFSDDLPLNVDAKQIIERTAGKWIIEASELVGLSKRDNEHLKSMLSRGTDGPVRLAYGRFAVEQPRQWIAIGTTNSHRYLMDDTGNRRFWPIRVNKFDLAWIRTNRDQLWAEAAQRESNGESIRLRPELYQLASLQQERRRVADPWESVMMDYFVPYQKWRVPPEEIWSKVLHIPIDRRDSRGQIRVSNILQRLGFRRMTVWDENKKAVKGWGRDQLEGQQELGASDETLNKSEEM